MRWLPLLWAALRGKSARSLYTLASIIVAFLLVGIMTGLSASFAQMIDKARMDRIVVTPRFGAWMPIAAMEQIARLDGVKQVVPSAFIGGTYRDPEHGIGIMMTDERYLAVHPETKVTPAAFAKLKQVQNGVIVNRANAERMGWSDGGSYPLETDRVNRDGTRVWTFQVVAIVPNDDENPTAGMAMGNYVYFNEARNDGRKNDIHAIDLTIADPERANPTSTAVERLFANSSTPLSATPERTLLENNIRGVLDMQFLTYAICSAALFMILFLTGNVMAQSVRERVPEFAVMKAVGFSDRGIFALVIAEAAVLCLVGAGLGLLAAKASPMLAKMVAPGAPVPLLTPLVIAIALAAALFVAAATGLPVAWRVRRVSIADALGGR
jgi:putative ABC transport system permease protein